MNQYALTIVVKSDLEEKARKELLEGFTKRIDKIEKEDLWGNRDLSYPILHQTKGYYAHYLFSSDPQSISPLDKALKVEEDVLRYLIVRR